MKMIVIDMNALLSPLSAQGTEKQLAKEPRVSARRTVFGICNIQGTDHE